MILLVHGWGFDAAVWNGVCADLADLPTARVDLGFFGAPAEFDFASLPAGEPLIGIGHSLGFLWLLRHAAGRCAALLSVNGFPRFLDDGNYPGVPASALARMRRTLQRDPGAVLSAFWSECGATPALDTASADRERLTQGLDWLRDWDARPILSEVRNLQILAGTGDRIVPEGMTQAAFAGRPIGWVESAGHALPLQQPKAVGAAVRRLQEALR